MLGALPIDRVEPQTMVKPDRLAMMHESASDFVRRPGEGLLYRNLMALVSARVRRSAHQPALRYKENGAWRTKSWAQWESASRALAAGLMELGVGRGDRVALMARTRVEWMIADLAIAMTGGVSVPIDPNALTEQVVDIIADSGATTLIVEDDAMRSALADGRLGPLQHTIVLDGTPGRSDAESWSTHRFDAVTEAGQHALESGPAAARLDALELSIGLEDEWTYVYTAGTTGKPKGAVLLHRNVVYQTWAIKNVVPVQHSDEQLVVLPLTHLFARQWVWAAAEQGAVTAFAESEDRIYANFIEIAPTFVAAVPNMYERAYARLRQAGGSGGIGRTVFEHALDIGLRVSRKAQRGEELPTKLAIQHAVADRMVLRPLREVFGGRVRFFIAGGAPLPQPVAEFFHALGLLILEGYGLSETGGLTHLNRLNRFRLGTVGPALPGCDVRLADDAEVQIRGHSVMARYHGRSEQTAAAFEADGWFKTGDTGELQDGFLRITDRKDDLIRTTRGKSVSPRRLEKRLRLREGIAHSMVCGHARPFVAALISLDEAVMLARSDREGLGCNGYRDLAVHPRIHWLVQAEIDHVNADLAHPERIRSFYIVPTPMSSTTGELTSTQSVRRELVFERYAEEIEALFVQESAPTPSCR